MAAADQDLLEALIEHAAAALGPIAKILVDQAAAGGAPFAEVRRQVAEQMDEDGRLRFLQATEPLAARARKAQSRAKAVASEAPSPPPARAPGATPDTIDRSDPNFVKTLARYLTTHVGPQGEAMVLEAAHRCRTKMQLCIRLANTVKDPELKDLLLRRALGESSSKASGEA